jgi:hypothetical protein
MLKIKNLVVSTHEFIRGGRGKHFSKKNRFIGFDAWLAPNR